MLKHELQLLPMARRAGKSLFYLPYLKVLLLDSIGQHWIKRSDEWEFIITSTPSASTDTTELRVDESMVSYVSADMI